MITNATQNCFRALADPTRRDIVRILAGSDMSIGQLTDQFDMTRAAVKKHLTVLEEGRLISVQPRGRERINRLEPQGLKTAAGWLGYFSEFWDERFAALRDAIENEEENNND
jgi:DNA-binding transcriptional ArsR family regulator